MRPSVRTGQTELAAVRANATSPLQAPGPPTFPVLGKTPVNLLAVQTTQSLIISAQLKLGGVFPPERELAALAELSIESRKPTAPAAATRRRGHEDHLAIVARLSHRDPDATGSAMHDHLSGIRRGLQASLARSENGS